MKKSIQNLDFIQSVDLLPGKKYNLKIDEIRYSWFEKKISRGKDKDRIRTPTSWIDLKVVGTGKKVFQELLAKRDPKLSFLDFSISIPEEQYLKSKLKVYFSDKTAYTYEGSKAEIETIYNLYLEKFKKYKLKTIETEVDE